MHRPLMLLALAALPAAHGQLMDRCGDCWCAPGEGGTCPADETGIVDDFDNDLVCVLSTFVMTNSPDFLELQSASGEDCYPFTESTGVLNNAPQTQLPPCVVPSGSSATATSACAYRYNPADTTCKGREYEVMTYDSEAAAVTDGATVTHSGGCGVCSSAQDFWARIDNLDSLERKSIICATTYTLSSGNDRFDKLVQCYQDMGFSTPCATLWGHSAAVNTIQCGGVCLPNASGFTRLNEDNPPICEFAPCLECSAGFQAEFEILAGRNLQNSGITERIVRPCEAFTRVEHDHCVGVEVDTEDLCEVVSAPSPTPPAPTGSGVTHHSSAVSLLAGFGGFAIMLLLA